MVEQSKRVKLLTECIGGGRTRSVTARAEALTNARSGALVYCCNSVVIELTVCGNVIVA
jgi:hypothetical protein